MDDLYLEDRGDGRTAVFRMAPVEIAVFADPALAEEFLDWLAARLAREPAPVLRERPTVDPEIEAGLTPGGDGAPAVPEAGGEPTEAGGDGWTGPDWSDEDDLVLVGDTEARRTIGAIARRLDRTPKECSARLLYLRGTERAMAGA